MFFRLVYGSRSNHLLLDQFTKYFIHVNVTRESSSLITVAVAKRYVIHLVKLFWHLKLMSEASLLRLV